MIGGHWQRTWTSETRLLRYCRLLWIWLMADNLAFIHQQYTASPAQCTMHWTLCSYGCVRSCCHLWHYAHKTWMLCVCSSDILWTQWKNKQTHLSIHPLCLFWLSVSLVIRERLHIRYKIYIPIIWDIFKAAILLSNCKINTVVTNFTLGSFSKNQIRLLVPVTINTKQFRGTMEMSPL